MKLIYTLLASFALTFASLAAGSAVVDFNDVLTKSKANASFESQITAIQKDIGGSFDKERKLLEDTYKELNEKRDTFSPKELAKREEELQKKVTDFQKRLEEKETNLRKSIEDVRTSIIKKLNDSIASIAKARSYDMVYNAAGLAYYPPSMDISNDVLRELDKVLPTVVVKKP
jgi:outer membrane protein